MKKIFMLIIFGIFLLVNVMALSTYAGESKTFDLEYEIVNCSIMDNTYDLEGLYLTWENTNFTISTAINYKPDTFTISCWVIKYEEEVKVRSSSRGGSSSSNEIVDNVSVIDYENTSKDIRYDGEEIIDEETIIGVETTEPTIEDEIKEKSSWYFWVLGGILILVVFYFTFLKKSHSLKHASHEQEKHTNEKED